MERAACCGEDKKPFTVYYQSLMQIDHYLKDADHWQSHNPVCGRFVCTICVVEIGVDRLIAVLTIAEHVV